MAKTSTSFTTGNGGGRPKGVQNKATKTVKDAVLAAFNDIQSDPKLKLVQFAKDYPCEFYRLAGRLIPTDIKADVRVSKIQLEIVRRNKTATA